MRNNRFTATIKGGIGQNANKLSIIIIAGAYHPRLKQKGPKGLNLVTEKYTLIDYQIDSLSKVFSNSEVILAVGYESELIIKKRNWNCRIIENCHYETSGELEYLRLALNNCTTRNVLIVLDDVFFKPEQLNGITKNGSSLLVNMNSDKTNNDIGVELNHDQVISFNYNSIHKWMHVAFICDNELDVLQKYCNNKENNKMFVYEGLEEIVRVGKKLRTYQDQNMNVQKI